MLFSGGAVYNQPYAVDAKCSKIILDIMYQ